MAEILNVKSIIDLLPLLLDYIVPGFIFLTIRSLSFSKDYTKDKYIIVKSIVISFVLMECIYPILTWIQGYIIFTGNIKRAIFIIVVAILAVVYIKFNVEDKILSILGNGITADEDYFATLINNKNGSWMRVYLNNENVIYLGKINYYDNKELGENRMIALANFITYTTEHKENEESKTKELENNSGNSNAIVLISMKNIKRIEIFK